MTSLRFGGVVASGNLIQTFFFLPFPPSLLQCDSSSSPPVASAVLPGPLKNPPMEAFDNYVEHYLRVFGIAVSFVTPLFRGLKIRIVGDGL